MVARAATKESSRRKTRSEQRMSPGSDKKRYEEWKAKYG
tara:strand:+ start:2136 stop:2252 length:117 start_codon:yes stop_codon:yes gene_type:complete